MHTGKAGTAYMHTNTHMMDARAHAAIHAGIHACSTTLTHGFTHRYRLFVTRHPQCYS